MSAPPDVNGAPVDKPEGEMPPKHISIKVRDGTGNEIAFKLKRTTPMEKLMAAYAQQQGKAPHTLRFFFDNVRLQKDHTFESEELDMQGGDVIDVHIEQTGGMDDPIAAEPAKTPGPAAQQPVVPSNIITLHVRSEEGREADLTFKLKRDDPLSKLCKAYAKYKGLNAKSFRYFFEGSRIIDANSADQLGLPEDTPGRLKMEEDDQIQVFLEQKGGMNDPEPETPAQSIEKPEPATPIKHVTLKVRDQAHAEVTFKIKSSTLLSSKSSVAQLDFCIVRYHLLTT